MKIIKIAQTEKLLSKLSRSELARLVLNYRGKSASVLRTVKDDIYELKTKFNALELEIHINETATDNLSKYIKILERNCYENEQYSRRDCLEISDISGSIDGNALE